MALKSRNFVVVRTNGGGGGQIFVLVFRQESPKLFYLGFSFCIAQSTAAAEANSGFSSTFVRSEKKLFHLSLRFSALFWVEVFLPGVTVEQKGCWVGVMSLVHAVLCVQVSKCGCLRLI